MTGVSTAKVIHNFGRAETVDRDALARLVASISRFLDPAQAIAAGFLSGVELGGRGLAHVALAHRDRQSKTARVVAVVTVV